MSYALAVMEISRGDASVGITMAAHVSLGSTPFYLFGSGSPKTKISGAARERRSMLWGFGLTEPQAGSDAGGTRTRAELVDGMWNDQRHEGVHHQ